MSLFPWLVPKEHAGEKLVGTAFHNKPSKSDKQYTRWLLREFYEHLPDAGNSPAAEYLRRKLDRILDESLWSQRAPIDEDERFVLDRLNETGEEGPNSIVDGRSVDSELLEALVEAARALFEDSTKRDDVGDPSQVDDLPKAVRCAYWSFEAVEKKAGRSLEDREAWDLLNEKGLPDLPELSAYKLPAFDTWSRYLRDARKARGEQKYSPRAGREGGSSIARHDEI